MLEDDYTTTVPDYIERSISAPPLSDYATFEDFLPSGAMNNPRRPKSVKSAHFERSQTESSRHAAFLEGLSASFDILDDTNLGSIKSLAIDSKPKTPLDLIQADFPLTPSALYSHTKFETTDSKSPSHQADETDELDDVLTGIDQSTLAMQDLLNPEDEVIESPIPSAVPVNAFPPPKAKHLAQPVQFPTQNVQNYAIYNQQQPQSIPANTPFYAYSPGTFPSSGGANGQSLNFSLLPQTSISDASAKTLPSSPQSYVLPQQNGYAGNDPSIGYSMGVAGTDGVQTPNGYFMGNPQMMMPSPMYMDYYRMGMAAGAFPQMAYTHGEMTYPQTTAEGMAYMPYPQQAMPGYWPPQAQAARLNDPTQQQQMMFFGQQSLDFNGMPQLTPQMMVSMMGMNPGGIMTPHGFIPGNAALQMGFQQMSNGMPNATGAVFMHPSTRNPAMGGNQAVKQESDSRRNAVPLANGRNQPNIQSRMTNQVQSNPSSMRDALVEEFRNTYGKTRQWEIKDLVGHVVSFCQDQHGSRFIQQRLEVAHDADKQLIFNEVIPNAHSLMTDVFGNYVIQKLFEFGNPDQCETLAALLSGQAVTLALQMYGCRVIQKALEYVQTPRLITLINEFEGQQVLRCVHDQNGNHVIQKCIEVICRVAKEGPPEMSDYLNSRILFILQSFKGRVKELSIHPYGCRVIQRILEYCKTEHKMLILEELRTNCRELIQDQYGNYVIQHVMQHGYDHDKSILLAEVQSRLLEYSQHKFASNVVEKCIQYADKQYRDEIIWTIINVTFDLNNPVDVHTGQCVLENMVRDPYANYVVQKVIDVSNESQRGAIIRYVRENIVQLRRYTYGKHIIVRLEKVSGEKF